MLKKPGKPKGSKLSSPMQVDYPTTEHGPAGVVENRNPDPAFGHPAQLGKGDVPVVIQQEVGGVKRGAKPRGKINTPMSKDGI